MEIIDFSSWSEAVHSTVRFRLRLPLHARYIVHSLCISICILLYQLRLPIRSGTKSAIGDTSQIHTDHKISSIERRKDDQHCRGSDASAHCVS